MHFDAMVENNNFSQLIIELKDKDVDIATEAAEKLGKLHNKEAIVPLIDAYHRSSKYGDFLGITAAESLYTLGDYHGVAFLLDLVCQAAPMNRESLKIILERGDARFVTGLQKITKDSKRMEFLKTCGLEGQVYEAIVACQNKADIPQFDLVPIKRINENMIGKQVRIKGIIEGMKSKLLNKEYLIAYTTGDIWVKIDFKPDEKLKQGDLVEINGNVIRLHKVTGEPVIKCVSMKKMKL